MTGKLYIDGIDAFTAYGVFILEGGYAQFVNWPSLKAIDINSWAEEDGIEPDLTAPVLDSREFTVKFGAIGLEADPGGFVYLLTGTGAYHDVLISDLGKTFRLRLVSNPDFSNYSAFFEFSLQFADDYPLKDYTLYAAPSSGSVPSSLYDLDAINLSQYGIRILEGSLSGLYKTPTVKANLLTNISSKSGATYDGQIVKLQEKDITLKCALIAASITEFWANYNALLYDFTRPGARELYVDDLGELFPCFYKSATVNSFSLRGKVWCAMNITLTIITFTLGDTEFILSAENGALISTEDGLYVIDLKYN